MKLHCFSGLQDGDLFFSPCVGLTPPPPAVSCASLPPLFSFQGVSLLFCALSFLAAGRRRSAHAAAQIPPTIITSSIIFVSKT